MKKVVSIFMGAALLLGSTSLTFAAKEGELLVWIGTNRDEAALQSVLDKFTADLGIPAKVEVVDPVPDKFQQAAATGDGPDIVMFAHDRFGDWAAGGLIDPVTSNAEITDGTLATGWDAVTFGGKVWGYPVGVEAIGLIYNKALLPTPPASFEEIADLDLPDGVTPIMWPYADTYFTFPMMTAGGAYAFQKGPDGNYNGKDTGVNNEGAVTGATLLKKMVDDGLMPKGVDYGVMDGAFAKGRGGHDHQRTLVVGGLPQRGARYRRGADPERQRPAVEAVRGRVRVRRERGLAEQGPRDRTHRKLHPDRREPRRSGTRSGQLGDSRRHFVGRGAGLRMKPWPPPSTT